MITTSDSDARLRNRKRSASNRSPRWLRRQGDPGDRHDTRPPRFQVTRHRPPLPSPKTAVLQSIPPRTGATSVRQRTWGWALAVVVIVLALAAITYGLRAADPQQTFRRCRGRIQAQQAPSKTWMSPSDQQADRAAFLTCGSRWPSVMTRSVIGPETYRRVSAAVSVIANTDRSRRQRRARRGQCHHSRHSIPGRSARSLDLRISRRSVEDLPVTPAN